MSDSSHEDQMATIKSDTPSSKLSWITPSFSCLQSNDIEAKNITNIAECGGPADDPNAPSCATIGPS
jgi:hypothetical protein